MRNFTLNRRNFLKMAGVTSVAAGFGGFPVNLKAHDYSDTMRSIMDYQVGTKTPNFCEMCFWNCGVDAYSVNGRVKKLQGNKLNPNNHGTLCAKGNAGVASTYDPDRVKYPLLRVGKRGEGKWKKISWDEAYEHIYKKLNPIIKKHGAKSIVGFAHGTGEHYFRTLINALGSPNVEIPAFSECRGSRAIGFSLTFGGGGIGGHEYFDMKNTKYMILFGRNMAGSLQVREAKDFIEGISSGAKLVYVDPRQSESAVKAHRWLQVNPGCDLALSLGLIHVLIRDNLVDMDFVREYCYGYNELREHVRECTPKWAQKHTGISAEDIEKTAWEFAKAAPKAIAIPPRRISRYGDDTQSARAIAILNALVGNYGEVGGIWVPSKFPIDLHHDEKPPKIDTQRADGAGSTYPLSPPNLGLANGAYKATLTQKPYPIKAWLIYATNPLGNTAVEANRLFEAMDKLDFILCVDTQLNDSAYFADLVLPESTYLERFDAPYVQKDAYPFIALRKPAIKPLYDTKHIFEICQGITKKFNCSQYFQTSPKKSIENLLNQLSKEEREKLENDGVLIYEKADPYPHSSGVKMHFSTPTGKIQLYAPQLEEFQDEFGQTCSPLPTFVPPKMPKKEEFRLLFGFAPAHSHSRTQNNWLLMELEGDSPIWIHPIDAKRLGIEKNDKVVMINTTTNRTSNPERVKITKRIKQGSLFVQHGFGHKTKEWSIGYDKGISDVYFCSNDVDPISGCSGFNNGFVKLKKA